MTKKIDMEKVTHQYVVDDFLNKWYIEGYRNDKTALRNLDSASKIFSEIYSIRLTNEEIGEKIILPWHNHHEKIELTPMEGFLVKEAAEKYLSISEEEYLKNAPECYSTFQRTFEQIKNHENIGNIILTAKPLNFRSYEKIKFDNSKFSHADGLHRLIATYIKGQSDLINNIFVYCNSKEELEAKF